MIVLKQGARRSSRWAFDLLHEVGHIIEGLDGSDGGVIDADDMNGDPSEEAANRSPATSSWVAGQKNWSNCASSRHKEALSG